MKVIEPYVEMVTPVNQDAVLERIELCGRVCYKSEGNIEQGSAEEFVRNIIKRGHEAVLEHCSFTVRFVCDRGVSHEIVRHRLASYCQESTRYCNYSRDKFGSEITVIRPCYLSPGTNTYAAWQGACSEAENAYFYMLKHGCNPQEARAVLPVSLKTELAVTANIREWRNILKLRTAPAAHPQMRQVMMELLRMLHEGMPVLFDDIWEAAK